MDLDAVLLARLQFAFTITFHIIFPAFTIGLSAYIATLGVLWLNTGAERYRRLMQFWVKIFAVSFAMGVVSGIVLSYQFGTNWSRFSVVVGNVIGPLIGYEVLTAFFLEATFLGILLFGFNRVPPWLYVLSATVVAVGTATSAFWILSANSWMQSPAGHEVRDGIAYPVDWLAVVFNPTFPYRLAHMVNAAYLTTGFVVLAVGARYVLAGRHTDEARTMLRMANRADRRARAVTSIDRRPAWAQHAQASADQDRRDGGALGRLEARRLPHLRLAGPEGREELFRDFDPTRLVAHSDPRMERPVPGPQGCGAVGNARRSCRCSSPSASCWRSAFSWWRRRSSAHSCGGAARCSRRAGICW